MDTERLLKKTIGTLDEDELLRFFNDKKAVLSKLSANWKNIMGDDTLFRR